MKSSPRVIKSAAVRLAGQSRVEVGAAFGGPADHERRVLERAGRRAAAVLQAARRQAVTLRETARRDGFAAGHEAGQRAAAARLDALCGQVEEAARLALEHRREVLAGLEGQVVRLVVEVARAVVGDLAADRPEVVHHVVRGALRRAGTQRVVRIRVAAENADDVRLFLPELGAPGTPEVAADATVAVGGCVIDTEAGLVDARIESQLEELERAFLREAGEG